MRVLIIFAENASSFVSVVAVCGQSGLVVRTVVQNSRFGRAIELHVHGCCPLTAVQFSHI